MSEQRKPCPSVPCPPWTEGELTVKALCNCLERWGHWGNPWGDPDCPIHGELVRANVERGRTVAPVELEVGRSHEGGRA